MEEYIHDVKFYQQGKIETKSFQDAHYLRMHYWPTHPVDLGT